ncbi:MULTISPECIES: DNA mismatch repair protein MutS [Arthrospira]|uniref:DNA mismatch repair protein MutS n=1 Tax=Limnospira platensis NIES-46 TaxID=1236695 RepID=A0A5M3T3E5_LIMPL|nr:DNA mismatch repair protein MutS [Arthrospira platensis]AMW28615.1 DNA mismatch repair protein MutS [Arthrospira platensis YZ]KDR57611.1 DNA mismatch repair protein MutS [Arthrospira platensis str. Paraca]MBD2669916.1 DNA mismatch repair protein MutS [Arthrospira platensis FACHB-439]MBD2712212.1 DNA mismatch repair protein MutS [Arthrospira platensis FACHB-835]MDF2210559.1 DNA mismatch repair protein MutS [Arthrospira platensis NCB002]MDT9184881.1 DNA mismatch repair protein MutS [Limnospi
MTVSPSGSESLPNNADYRQLDRSQLSEMMQRYIEVKDQYPHALLFFRVGDFFECFFQDAITISQELELVQTTKSAGKEIGRVPMTGVPFEHVYRYSNMLLEKGYPVVICDQVEDAAIAAKERRQVKREITRILTPGTLTDDQMLRGRQNNFLAAVVIAGDHWGLAYADVSTGEFLATQSQNLEHLTQELMRLQPSEILFPTHAPDLGKMLRPGQKSESLPDCLPADFCYSLRSQIPFTLGEARSRILEEFKLRSLEGIGCENLPLGVRAAGGLLEYLEETQKQNVVPLQQLHSYTLSDYLILDYQTRRNLEITKTIRDGTLQGSLLWAIDKTSTAMGARALRRWLLQPLLSIKGICSRYDTIEELINNVELRQDLQQLLRQIYDLERLTGRAANGSANAKDLVGLADSLSKLPQLAQLSKGGKSPYLKALQNVPPLLEELAKKINSYIVESPPLYLKEGGLIKPGVDPQLDQMQAGAAEDQQWIANLEIQERERTGISTLKVGFNKTFGYYISITRSKSDQAPDDYIRKQTLTNEERYITPELKEREARILTAKEDLNQLEYEIFARLRGEVGEHTDLIREISRAIAAIDVLCGLAEIAVYQGYCRPEIVGGRELKILEGRHPVVEKSLPTGFFVPNNAHLGSEEGGLQKQKLSPPSPPDLIILTGPNASGKSCYLRQVGLIQLMAQIGSFVPATSARLSICDRIFTRVGAVDDLATGQSTFMVEMNETANILNHATPKSLVLLDEIGRGTATFDGLSIAWSVAEYLATTIKARTIFATHYHELNELASILGNVANYQVTVKELPDKIIFLHQVQPGGADKSYGIEAGRLAGLPDVVIKRAKQVMRQIEKHSKIAMGLRKGIQKPPANTTNIQQLNIFDDDQE